MNTQQKSELERLPEFISGFKALRVTDLVTDPRSGARLCEAAQHPFRKSFRKFILATVGRRSQNHWFTVWLLLSIFFLSAAWTRAETAVQAWVQRYGNDVVSHDHAEKVVTDNAGNVIVAGMTDERITAFDMLVIKYSGAGLPLWTNRYNGPGNSYDYVSAVAVDGSGNVFVTGYSASTNAQPLNYDYATIKGTSGNWERNGSGGECWLRCAMKT